ncbi:hypothetical protein M2M59_09485 [Rummeliibacillus sp. G93]|uniref:hypothetical protein n=1 Tax=Rummeliibacillus TaxID=648802 RepID=UPI00201B9FFB|nr:hypothetical protein [Rummeliibacillus sp. G93]UQW96245.1 hypothetical protein M2M59_09485 [Rummeliibacillus sp. G93]
MLKLLSINIIPVIIIRVLLFFLTQTTWPIIYLVKIFFELFTPILLLRLNYKVAVKKEKTYFISNSFLILFSSLLGVALGYLFWGLDASGFSLQDDLGQNILKNPDNETAGIVKLEAIINVTLSILGSLLCSIILIMRNRKKSTIL